MPTTTVTLLRRFDQPLEILPPPDGGAGPDSLRVLAYPAVDRLQRFKDADLLYSVDLPGGYDIRPADWRALVDNRDTVELLLGEIVVQNLAQLRFEPLSATLLRRAEVIVRLALGDLARIFDVRDVRCEALDERVQINVTGDHKNGAHRQCAVVLNWGD